MINTGQCPGCKKTMAKARFETVEILDGFTPAYFVEILQKSV